MAHNKKPKLRRIIEGLQLIEKIDATGDVDAQHDEFFAGSISQMSPEEQAQMEELGWRRKEEYDCWAIFT